MGISCSQEKWDKAKGYLREISAEIAETGVLHFKALEQKRGFFVHLQRTYPCLTPFLKGFHNTLDSWRTNRDAEGWKVAQSNTASGFWDESNDQWITFHSPSEHPTHLTPVPQLHSDLTSLGHLMSSPTPPVRLLRSSTLLVATYGFADASGAGFGSSIALPDGSTRFRHGFWGRDAESRSSNYRELRNLVETVEEFVQSGEHIGTELFLFTDNATAEGAYYKGNSDNKLLFELILRLRTLDMNGHLKLHVIHIAGTRMVSQGTDGLSRGDYTTGVMAGDSMSSFIPLHLSAFERSPSLLAWVQTWVPSPAIAPLTPVEWFSTGHGISGGNHDTDGAWIPCLASTTWFLWAPAPGAAEAAVDQLAISRHKRPHLNHVFLCPRLLTSTWRKKLFRTADLVLELHAGCYSHWPTHMHEPLLLGLTFHFIQHPPWQLRNTPRLLELGGQVQRLWKSSESDVGSLLFQLCNLPNVLEGMPEYMVWPVLHSPPS